MKSRMEKARVAQQAKKAHRAATIADVGVGPPLLFSSRVTRGSTRIPSAIGDSENDGDEGISTTGGVDFIPKGTVVADEDAITDLRSVRPALPPALRVAPSPRFGIRIARASSPPLSTADADALIEARALARASAPSSVSSLRRATKEATESPRVAQ